jgi:sorbitol-6-phosphate 2-dehydrogenase
MNKSLIVFGGGPSSLGETFFNSTIRKYIPSFNYNINNGTDCTIPDAVEAACSEASMYLDRLKNTKHEIEELHIVNFVGMMDTGFITEFSDEQFQKITDTNLRSLFLIAKFSIPLLAQYNGRFVTLGSNAGEQPFSGMSAYCATKYAVQGFVKCMAKEMARFNVPCNVVNPGALSPESSMMSSIQVEQFKNETGKSQEEVMEMLTSRIPMKRLCTATDLESLILALLNQYPRFYTGQSVSLSGGQVM